MIQPLYQSNYFRVISLYPKVEDELKKGHIIVNVIFNLLFYKLKVKFVISNFKVYLVMMNKYVTIICFLSICFVHSQENRKGTILRVEPNGVVVYKPIDVEQTLGLKSELVVKRNEHVNKSKTIDDFSLEELEDILYYVNLKIEKITNTEDNLEQVNYYLDQKKDIETRIQSIKKNNNLHK